MSLKPLNLTNAKGATVPYRVRSETIHYKGIPLSCGICYSSSQKQQKEKTLRKKVTKEQEDLGKPKNTFTRGSG